MLKTLIPILLLFVSIQSTSQNYFKGLVSEEDTSMNVTDAIVVIEGTAIAQSTDLNGAFNFTEKIPDGEHLITITKEGYVTRHLLIDFVLGNNVIMNDIKIEVNKKEKKRREKAIKEQGKLEKKQKKQRDKSIAIAKKEKEKKLKGLEKEKKKLQKQKKKNHDDAAVSDEVVYSEPSTTPTASTPIITSIQIKYGTRLDVTPETITNNKLYEFIEEWEGTNYLLGGASKDGIDCSSFTQRLYTSVYDMYIERTAEKQFNAKQTDKFLGKEFLSEGDLIFFKGSGENKNTISHVGIYLQNNYFVHATSYTKDNGLKGVKISNLKNGFWSRRFVAGGRRLKN